MKSKIISKIGKLVTEHPTLVTFGLGLAITLAIGAAIGMLDNQQAFAAMPRCTACLARCGSYCG